MSEEPKPEDLPESKIKNELMLTKQSLDFNEVRRNLEEIIEEVQASAPSDLIIHQPLAFQKNDSYSLTQVIESPALNKGVLFEVMDLFWKFYGSGTRNDLKIIAPFGDSGYQLIHYDVSAVSDMDRRVNLFMEFNSETKINNGGTTSRLGPHVQIGLVSSKGFYEEDFQFAKETLYKLVPEKEKATDISQMKKLGLIVYDDISEYGWDFLAGYEKTKAEIESKIVRPNLQKGMFEKIRNKIMKVPGQTGYNCYLFFGPPGTGKTEAGKVTANRLGYQFFELPLDAVMTKWYGEGEKKLGEIFNSIRKAGPSVLFIDEIDCLAGSRDAGMHESTQRMLSVLMTNLAKTKQGDDLVVIAATNKPEKLDDALSRRLNKKIEFPNTDYAAAVSVYKHYAQQLSESVVQKLARSSEGLSPFDIANVCNHAIDLHVQQVTGNDLYSYEFPSDECYFDSLKDVKSGKEESSIKKRKIGFFM